MRLLAGVVEIIRNGQQFDISPALKEFGCQMREPGTPHKKKEFAAGAPRQRGFGRDLCPQQLSNKRK
jgi:hypothetical protein